MPKSLRSFFCEHHNSVIECSKDVFDVDTFVSEADIPDKNDFIVRTDGLSSRKSWKEHGHIAVEGSEDELKIDIILHAGPLENPSDGPPIETKINDLLSKLESDTVRVRSSSHFRFPKGYLPKVILNYPALLDEDNPDSAVVSGQEVRFKDPNLASTAFIRYTKEQCLIIVRAVRELAVEGLEFHDIAARDFKAAQLLAEKISE